MVLFDINKEILTSIETEWKSIPEITKELNVNIMRVHKHIKSLEKTDQVLSMYGEKNIKKRGKIPIVYKRR